jgi:hypothetical protein
VVFGAELDKCAVEGEARGRRRVQEKAVFSLIAVVVFWALFVGFIALYLSGSSIVPKRLLHDVIWRV